MTKHVLWVDLKPFAGKSPETAETHRTGPFGGRRRAEAVLSGAMASGKFVEGRIVEDEIQVCCPTCGVEVAR